LASATEDSDMQLTLSGSNSDDDGDHIPLLIEREFGGYLRGTKVEGSMDTFLVVVIIVIAVAMAVGVAAALHHRRGCSDQLRQRFGPEYEHAVASADNRRAAERELRGRERRRSASEVMPLNEQDAALYRQAWAEIRLRFVDQPVEVVGQAERLVVQIMRDSGYPVDDFEQRVDDISVDHPEVAQHYREAHSVAIADAADTEQLRQAVASYGQLVDALLRETRRPGPEADRASSTIGSTHDHS